ncbi:hypothetical protein [Levilactobacillus tongjiangensis]|uniref:hypothetical protein n=1 Tax=Levilactobacillus tongjiangensis TaxID=2486023 RepID=UPI000F7A31CF|nr:hypothetical protein [Levilactobacillus tongjiangensis]
MNNENVDKRGDLSSNFHESDQIFVIIWCKTHQKFTLFFAKMGKYGVKKAVYVTVTLQILRNVIQ